MSDEFTIPPICKFARTPENLRRIKTAYLARLKFLEALGPEQAAALKAEMRNRRARRRILGLLPEAAWPPERIGNLNANFTWWQANRPAAETDK